MAPESSGFTSTILPDHQIIPFAMLHLHSKRFIWPFLIALLIVPLLLLPEAVNMEVNNQQKNGTLGRGNHKLDNGRVMLAKDTTIVKDGPSLKHYNNITGTCNVSLDGENRIRLTYDKQTAENGCTVNLALPAETAMFKFEAEVMDAELGCLLQCGAGSNKSVLLSSGNLMPFVYSKTNEEFEKLKNGPPAAESDDNNCDPVKCSAASHPPTFTCMNETFLEIGWSKCNGMIHAFVHPVGEPVFGWKQAINESGKERSIKVKIEDKQPRFTSANFTSESKPPVCFNPEKIVAPETWPIDEEGAPEELKGKNKRLLVFHLLPQTATRIHDGKKVWNVAPTGPRCVGNLSIVFDAGYLLISEGNPPPEVPKAVFGAAVLVVILIGTLAFIFAAGFVLYWFCLRAATDDENAEDKEDEDTGKTSGSAHEPNGV